MAIIIPLNQYTGGPVNIPTAMPARLQRQDLINPNITQRDWFGQPFNVLPYVKYQDMIDAATRGLKLGDQLASLPLAARERANQYAMQGLVKASVESLNKQIKDIQNDKTLGDRDKTEQINQLLRTSGMSVGGQGTVEYSPWSGMMTQAQYNILQATHPYLGGGGVTNRGGGPPPPPAKAGTDIQSQTLAQQEQQYLKNQEAYQLHDDGKVYDDASGQLLFTVPQEHINDLRAGKMPQAPQSTSMLSPAPLGGLNTANLASLGSGNVGNPMIAPINLPQYNYGGAAPNVPVIS